MSTARSGQTATLLPDGKVLVAGGGTASAELYNPATRTFSATGRMPVAVTGATATLLHDGKVLVAGGLAGRRPVTDAELYDPATGTWAPTGSMRAARAWDTATLLPDGKVLAAGGRCNGKGFFVCTPGVYAKSLRSAELYDPATGTWTPTGSMRTGRMHQSATLLPDGKVLAAGGQVYCDDGICVDTSSAELYNPATGTWAATGSMSEAREQHSATLLPDGAVLVAGGTNVSGISGFSTDRHAELYDPATGTWRPTAPMATGHVGQSATLLRNGWVLLAGGYTRVAEIYQPQRAIWVLPGAMSVQRTHQTATLLPGGHVLVTGGRGPDGRSLATAEEFLAGNGPLVSITPASIAFGGQQVGTGGTRTYQVTNQGSADLVSTGVALTGRNPGDFGAATDCAKAPVVPGGTCMVSVRFSPGSTGLRTAVAMLSDNAPRTPQAVALSGYGGGPDTWVPVGPMATAREDFTATVLPNGDVLVAGGVDNANTSNAVATAELYNPATRSFAAAEPMHAARSDAAAVLLGDGQVLVAGGTSNSTGNLPSAELYDPATGRWSVTTPMHAAGYGITATLLRSGKVLVTGLDFGASAEVYDPAKQTWTDTGPMTAPQFFGTATLLRDGRVLAVGGGTSAAELYDPATNSWTSTAPLLATQVAPAATLLPDGLVLVAGGSTAGVNGHSLATSELYHPATGSWHLTGPMAAGRSGAIATLLPDGTVLVGGGSRSRFSGHGLSSSELFLTGGYSPAAPMTQPRVYAAAALLPAGDVLVAGGDASGSPTSTAELYTPILMSMSPGSGPPGTRVTVSGSNFYAHETVKVLWYVNDKNNDFKVIGEAATSASGTFTTKVTVPAGKLGRHLVIASGSRSSRTQMAAQTTFTVTG